MTRFRRLVAAAILLTLVAGPARAATLVGYWKLDETATTGTLADSAGSNPLTIAGTLGNTTPPAAITFSDTNAKTCNGTSTNNAASAAATGIPDVSTAFSISVWFKATDFTQSALLSIGTGGGSASLGVYSNAISLSTWANPDDNASVTVTSGVWHHIAYTFDGSVTPIIYYDGTAQTTNFSGSHATGSPNSIVLFGNSFGDSWNGAADEVRIYSGVLTSTEVSTLFSGGAVPPIGGSAAICDSPFSYGVL